MFKTKEAGIDLNQANRVFTTREVSQGAKVSLRQLQWWDESKLVSPRHAGHRRVYRFEDAVEASVVAELRRKGFSLRKIRRIVRLMHRKMGRWLSEILAGDSDLYLLTDGASVHLEESPGRIIDLAKKSRQPMSLICISDQVRRLQTPPKKPAQKETKVAWRKSRAV